MRPVWPLAGSYGHLPFPSSRAAGLRVKSSAFCKQTQIHTHTQKTMRGAQVAHGQFELWPTWQSCKPRPSGALTPLPCCPVASVSHARAHLQTHTAALTLFSQPLCATLLFCCIYFCFVTRRHGPSLPPPGSDVSGWHLSATACHDSIQKNTHTNTYDVIAFGLEGVGAAGVEVRVVVALQEANVVEALSLRREEWEKGIIGVGFFFQK